MAQLATRILCLNTRYTVHFIGMSLTGHMAFACLFLVLYSNLHKGVGREELEEQLSCGVGRLKSSFVVGGRLVILAAHWFLAAQN